MRRATRIALLTATLALTLAASPPPEAERAVPGGQGGWATDGAGGCWVYVSGIPAGATDLAATWSGNCPEGPAEGAGQSVMRWHVGGGERSMTYEGTLRRGKAEGPGRLTHREGREVVVVEDGEYRDDQLVQGRLEVLRSGLVYEGGFQRGQPHGQGQVRVDGRTYSGEWIVGCLDTKEGWLSFTRPASECEGRPT